MDEDKLCKIDETVGALENFIYWLAQRSEDPDNVMMSFDDLVGEFFEELVKGVKRYGNLPTQERSKIIRRMIDNRLGELRYRYYVTHRKNAKLHISIDMEYDEDDNTTAEDIIIVDNEYNPDAMLDSKERVELTRSKLSPSAQKVFDALVSGNTRLNMLVLLSAMRATAIYKSPTAVVSQWNVAEALFMPLEEVKAAFVEIKKAYSEVLDE